MTLEELRQRIVQDMADADIAAEGEGCNFAIRVVSTQFDGVGLVARQKRVLNLFQDQFASGELHALSVKAYSPQEWERTAGQANQISADGGLPLI